jgi:hypothetical protein
MQTIQATCGGASKLGVRRQLEEDRSVARDVVAISSSSSLERYYVIGNMGTKITIYYVGYLVQPAGAISCKVACSRYGLALQMF